MRNCVLAVGILFATVNFVFGQGLEDVPPILITESAAQPAVERQFILSTTDFNKWFNDKAVKHYANSAEIVDANEPWPPRWFVSAPLRGWDTIDWKGQGITEIEDLLMDARYQNGYFTFFKQRSTTYNVTHKIIDEAHYIICNSRLQPVDTFNRTEDDINYHDFRVNAAGEKMAMIILDTVLNMSKISGNPGDTAVKAQVDIIEIVDKNNKVVFRWNPVSVLGVSAFNYPYVTLITVSGKPGYLDWSHGNSIGWDYDGNILYGFRHVGVGKISRTDGSVIWRMDRNRMPYTEKGMDDISFYLQHAFDRSSDHEQYTTYTVFSNGDKDHPLSYALVFKVNKKNNAIHFMKKKEIQKVKVMALRHGNYDMAANGDYVLNYGQYICDSTPYRPFLEYGDSTDRLYALYSMPSKLSAYKVHMVDNWKPPRPAITEHSGKLVAAGNMSNWTWYQLSGKDNREIVMVGKGANFSPPKAGIYCVAGKYGVGYAVSKAFVFK